MLAGSEWPATLGLIRKGCVVKPPIRFRREARAVALEVFDSDGTRARPDRPVAGRLLDDGQRGSNRLDYWRHCSRCSADIALAPD